MKKKFADEENLRSAEQSSQGSFYPAYTNENKKVTQVNIKKVSMFISLDTYY